MTANELSCVCVAWCVYVCARTNVTKPRSKHSDDDEAEEKEEEEEEED